MDEHEQYPFNYDGKDFKVPAEAADHHGNIRLPDGRVLRVSTWTRSLPPQPVIFGIATAEEALLHPTFNAVAV